MDSIDSVSLTKNGVEHPFATSYSIGDGALRIQWDVGRGTGIFALWHRIRGGMQLDNSGDRAVWSVRFTPSPLCHKGKDSRITMLLPDSLAGQVSDFQVSGNLDSDSVTIDLIDPRTVTATADVHVSSNVTQALTVQGTFPHGLLDVPTPDWQQPEWRRETKELFDWRQSPFRLSLVLLALILVALLPVIRRKINRSWPPVEYPTIESPVTEPPSDLPAPAASLLVNSGEVSDRTLLTLLVDMANKGILEVSARYEWPDRVKAGNYTYRFVSRSNPQIISRFNWESHALRAISQRSSNPENLLERWKYRLGDSKESIAIALGEHLESAGLFDRNPAQVRKENGWQFWALMLGAVLSGVGLIILSDLFLPLLLSIPAGIVFAFLYLGLSLVLQIGKLAPSETGLRETAQWRNFGESVPPPGSTSPDEPDPILPYAVALDAAKPWLIGTPTPSWFVLEGLSDTGDRDLAYLGFLSVMDQGLDGANKDASEAVMRQTRHPGAI